MGDEAGMDVDGATPSKRVKKEVAKLCNLVRCHFVHLKTFDLYLLLKQAKHGGMSLDVKWLKPGFQSLYSSVIMSSCQSLFRDQVRKLELINPIHNKPI